MAQGRGELTPGPRSTPHLLLACLLHPCWGSPGPHNASCNVTDLFTIKNWKISGKILPFCRAG